MGHSVPTPEHTFSAEDYVVVEAGLFGPAGAHTTLSRDDFSLRINGKKTALPSEPYELVFQSLKDPEWQPPEAEESKDSKGGLTTGGGGGGGDKLPPIPPENALPVAPRDGTAGSKGRHAGRRPSAAPSRPALLPIPRQSGEHQIAGADLQRRRGQGYADAAA